MRLTNRNRAGMYNTLFTFSNITLGMGLFLIIFDSLLTQRLGIFRVGVFAFGVFLMLLLWFRGRPIFEYDSDGEALNFRNYSPFPFIFKKESRDEFPKYKFHSYELVNMGIAKFLYIKITSRKSAYTILKYEISYLTHREIIDLKISLNKLQKAKSNG